MFFFNFYNVMYSVIWVEYYGIVYKFLFEFFYFVYFVGLKFNVVVMMENVLKERLDQ